MRRLTQLGNQLVANFPINKKQEPHIEHQVNVNVAAFQIFPTLSEIPEGKLTSITSFQDIIYVGTSTCSICLFQLQHTNIAYFTMKKYLGEGKNVSILQLYALSSLSSLFVRTSNGLIFILDFKTLTRQQNYPNLTKLKNVNYFCFNAQTGNSIQLCVSTKKRIHLFNYQNNNFTIIKEMNLTDSPRSMLWHGSSIIIGSKKDYSIHNIDSEQIANIHVPVNETTPLIQLTDSEEILLTSNAGVGIFVGWNTEPAQKSNIAWSSDLEDVAKCGYYIVALSHNGIDIFSLIDQKLVQKIEFAKGLVLFSDGSQVFVASANKVSILKPTPVEQQVSELLSFAHVNEALSLLYKTSPTTQRVRVFHADAGWVLFRDLQFEEAMKHFSLSDIDPRELINLFSVLCLSGWKFESTDERSSRIDITEVISKSRKLRIQKLKMKSENKTEDSGRFEGIDQILTKSDEEIFWYAHFCLAWFLWNRRNNPTPGLEFRNLEIKVGVDTVLLILHVLITTTGQRVLMKSQFKFSDSDTWNLPYTLEQLLLPSNSCLPSDSEAFLIERKQYHALAMLYQSRELYRKALETWEQLGSGSLEETTNAPGARQNGVMETIQCLSMLSDTSLIFQFSPWVLMTYPEKAMKIFTSSSRNQPLSSDKVLQFLQNIVPPNDFDFIEVYLEHLIFFENNDNPKYHNMLARLYMKKVEKLKITSEMSKSDNLPILNASRKKFRDFLTHSTLYDVKDILQEASKLTLYPEIIILYSRLGRHSEVLKVFVYNLRDDEGAVDYCITRSGKDYSLRSSFFTLLLGIYFKPDLEYINYEKSITIANQILVTNASEIDPIEVLHIIPNSLPTSTFQPYFEKVLTSTIHKKRDLQIIRSLSKSNNFTYDLSLQKEKSKYIEITKETRCNVCKKPIDKYVFQLYPNLDCIHMSCNSKYLLRTKNINKISSQKIL